MKKVLFREPFYYNNINLVMNITFISKKMNFKYNLKI